MCVVCVCACVQLLVDGHGPGYDANMWKLLSGGVSFQIAPDPPSGSNEPAVPLYHMYYSPLLRDHHNVIPTSMSGLGAAVQWCKEHDSACARIAINARETVQQVLNVSMVLEYMWHVTTSLYDWHKQGAAA